jgi:hypothetical protein
VVLTQVKHRYQMDKLQKNGITGGRLIIGGEYMEAFIYVSKELYMQSINPYVKDGRDPLYKNYNPIFKR